MKIYTVNDLHIEIGFWEPPAGTGATADLVVLAGDIGRHADGLIWAREAFAGKRVIYVAGNHEFYGAEYHEMRRELRRTARELGIDLLENDEVVIDGVRFLGCTLWTDFRLYGDELDAMDFARRRMNDFLRIRFEGSPTVTFRPEDSAVLHQQSRAWLEARLAEPFAGKTVVVTHHAPSLASIDQQWKEDLLTAAFASHLDPLVAQANLWLHGHTHGFADHRIGDCRVVCNPRGYVRDGRALETTGWEPELVVEV